MGRVFSNRRILGLAAACLFLFSLPVGGTQPAAYLEELKALAELHEQGLLTDEEFAAKKAQLLGLDTKEATLETAEEPTRSQEQAPDAGQPKKIKLAEGTEIYLVFAEALSSGSNTEGDRFHLRVDDDVKVDGSVVIPRDAIAVGTVKVAKKRRRMGRAGELSIMLDYVKAGDERVRLRSNKTKEGEGKVGSTVALTVLFGPLGLLKRGKDIEVQEGSPITAYVDQDVELIVPVDQDVEHEEPAAGRENAVVSGPMGEAVPPVASPDEPVALGSLLAVDVPGHLVVDGEVQEFGDVLFRDLEPGPLALELRREPNSAPCWKGTVTITQGTQKRLNFSRSCE